jgi:hypothetical protein
MVYMTRNILYDTLFAFGNYKHGHMRHFASKQAGSSDNGSNSIPGGATSTILIDIFHVYFHPLQANDWTVSRVGQTHFYLLYPSLLAHQSTLIFRISNGALKIIHRKLCGFSTQANYTE